MEDDPTLRALTAHPRHRRVLITDMRAPEALPLVRALLAEGAARVFVGEAESWRRWPGRAAFEALERVEIVPPDPLGELGSGWEKMAAERMRDAGTTPLTIQKS